VGVEVSPRPFNKEAKMDNTRAPKTTKAQKKEEGEGRERGDLKSPQRFPRFTKRVL